MDSNQFQELILNTAILKARQSHSFQRLYTIHDARGYWLNIVSGSNTVTLCTPRQTEFVTLEAPKFLAALISADLDYPVRSPRDVLVRYPKQEGDMVLKITQVNMRTYFLRVGAQLGISPLDLETGLELYKATTEVSVPPENQNIDVAEILLSALVPG